MTAIALPVVAGPIPVTAESGPLFSGVPSPVGLNEPPIAELLAPYDYVEEEFFISGTAEGQPYKTTLLVRRPRNSARFSGLVALEPVHVQGALGLWQTGHTTILAGGHAWVAVGSQRGAVEGLLKLINPARYADLQVPEFEASKGGGIMEALAAWGQATAGSVPPELFTVDTVSNEILTQVGALLKSEGAGRLFGGRNVTTLLMAGASQTGVHTLNFIANAHSFARLPDGGPIYDGYLPMATPGIAPVHGGDAAVVHIFSEGDFPLFAAINSSGYLGSRPDSDAPGDRYRGYAITASAHLPMRGLRETREVPLLGLVLAPQERFTQFPSAPFYNAALANLIAWVVDGVAPPHASPVEIADGEIALDEHGNAKGGLRSPYVDVPTSTHFPARHLRHLVGAEELFSAEKLRSLYGSREGYLQRFNGGIDALVAGRLLLPEDANVLKAEEAEHAPRFG